MRVLAKRLLKVVGYQAAPDPREVSFFLIGQLLRSVNLQIRKGPDSEGGGDEKKDTACGQEDSELRSGNMPALIKNGLKTIG